MKRFSDSGLRFKQHLQIRQIGRAFCRLCGDDLIVFEKKHTGHLQSVAREMSDAATVNQRHQSAYQTRGPKSSQIPALPNPKAR